MKTLFCLEWKKLLSEKYLSALFLILTALTVWRVNGRGLSHFADPYDVPAYTAVDAEIRGEMTEDKIRKVIAKRRECEESMGTGNGSDELDAYWQIYGSVQYQYEYAMNMQQHLENAKAAEAYYLANGNETGAAEAALCQEIYAGRFLRNYYNTNDFSDYHAQSFASLCIFFLLAAMLLPVFTGEHTGNTQPLLRASAPGMRKILPAKLLTAFFAVLLVCVWLHLTEFLAVLPKYHLDGWEQPLYAAEHLQFTTLSCTNLEMIFLRLFMRLLTGWTWALTILLISACCRKMLTAVASVLSVFAVLLAGTEHLQTLWNPFYTVQVLRWSQTFSAVHISGKAVIPLTAAIVMQLMSQAVLLSAVIVIGRKRRCLSC